MWYRVKHQWPFEVYVYRKCVRVIKKKIIQKVEFIPDHDVSG